MTWAVFFDRDGVLTSGQGLISKPEDLKLIAGAAEAVRRLKDAGALTIMVTNQPVVARGLITEQALHAIHERLERLLGAEGAKFDAIYYCPHHPETHHPEAQDPRYRLECACRKPKTGMFKAAAERFAIEAGRSFMIGDSTRDILAARNFGCRPVLVRTGNAGKDGTFACDPEAVCDDVASAADWILAQGRA